jgi:hypothetical protein
MGDDLALGSTSVLIKVPLGPQDSSIKLLGSAVLLFAAINLLLRATFRVVPMHVRANPNHRGKGSKVHLALVQQKTTLLAAGRAGG